MKIVIFNQSLITFRGLDAEFFETIRMGHGQDNGFDKLLDLFVQSTDVAVVFSWPFIQFHGLDPGVKFRRQSVEDQKRVLVDTYQVSRFQLFSLDQTHQR